MIRLEEPTSQRLFNYLFYIRLYLQNKKGQIDFRFVQNAKESIFEACKLEYLSDSNKKELFRVVEELAKVSIEVCRDIVFTEFENLLQSGGF